MAAHRGHHDRVLLVQPKGGIDGTGTIDEEANGVVLGHFI
jgi:hypothetical protein